MISPTRGSGSSRCCETRYCTYRLQYKALVAPNDIYSLLALPYCETVLGAGSDDCSETKTYRFDPDDCACLS